LSSDLLYSILVKLFASVTGFDKFPDNLVTAYFWDNSAVKCDDLKHHYYLQCRSID